jgi:hypothetical protein
MNRPKLCTWAATLLGALCVYAGSAHGTDIGGTISSTLTITSDSQLVDDVTCTVVGVPCIAIGASHVTLDLNGFTMTGQADPQNGCSGVGTSGENGIDVNAQIGAQIRGPGLVKQFRGFGIRLQNSTGGTIMDVTVSTSCFSGIFVSGGSDHQLDRNVAVRNGHGTNPCGGI